jgi:phosphoribosylformylglycinamidine cyclo-ligase
MITYKESGVDIDAGNEAVNRIKPLVKSTFNKNVLRGIGNFAGLFKFDKNKYQEPVLVSSTDGVGTKLKLAFKTNKHDTIGVDLVNHCVNDILVLGAKPLFFLDYIAMGKLVVETVEQIVGGLSKACKENDCALIAGETAELPKLYKEGEYDLASFIVGVVEKNEVIDGSKIEQGDIIIGLASNGLHTNGYSLALKVLERELNKYSEELMKPHISYLKPIHILLKEFEIKGMAHITGGGFFDNIPRILPHHLGVEIQKSSWSIPSIFKIIQEEGNIEEKEMFRTFNMGIGLILIVNKQDADKIINRLDSMNFKSYLIGRVVKGEKEVRLI